MRDNQMSIANHGIPDQGFLVDQGHRCLALTFLRGPAHANARLAPL